jgi:hypothetical protein
MSMMIDNTRDEPSFPRPSPDAERCMCDCHRSIGRAVHFAACCMGGWKYPVAYREVEPTFCPACKGSGVEGIEHNICMECSGTGKGPIKALRPLRGSVVVK